MKHEHNAKGERNACNKKKEKKEKRTEKKKERVTIVFRDKTRLTQQTYAVTTLQYLIGKKLFG